MGHGLMRMFQRKTQKQGLKMTNKNSRMNLINQSARTILTISVVACLSSCAVTPKITERETVAYDGNQQNAGIIQNFPDHSSEITASARQRYNDLILSQEGILKYYSKKDYGITPLANGHYKITAEGKEYWYSLKLEANTILK